MFAAYLTALQCYLAKIVTNSFSLKSTLSYFNGHFILHFRPILYLNMKQFGKFQFQCKTKQCVSIIYFNYFFLLITAFPPQKYAALLEKEKVGAAELPYVGEDKLRALGVPLGPRMRILKEAGIHQDLHHLSRDDPHNTTTTLAIV